MLLTACSEVAVLRKARTGKPLHLSKSLSALAQQLVVLVLLPPWTEDNGGKVL